MATSDKLTGEPTRRERIIIAAFKLFMQRGYAGTSTLAIASEAKLSKRDLYAAFTGKREILAECIGNRGAQMRAPLDLPAPRSVAELQQILIRFGIALRLGLADPQVIATYRMAVQEAPNAPELAQVLDAGGRAPSYTAVVALMANAQARHLLGPGSPEHIAGQFLSLLVGDSLLQHLLGLAPPETEDRATARSQSAAHAILALYPGIPPRPAPCDQ